MRKFKFRGFSIGTSVNVSDIQGTSSDSATVTTWGQGAATPITLSLGSTRLSGTAPFGAIYTATATSPAARVVSPYHDIESVWTFDDPGNFTALGNSPIWGTDRNVAYGPHAAHVHSAPGDYVVTCTSHDGENFPRSETIEITVDKPNTVFGGDGGEDTAVVSNGSGFGGTPDYTGKPTGAAEFTTISAAKAHLSGRTNARLLLRRGDTFTEALLMGESGGSGRKLHIGAFGIGDKPHIQRSGITDDGIKISSFPSTSNYDEIAIWGLKVTGIYDPTDPPLTGDCGGVGIDLFNAPLDCHKTIWDMEVTNFGGMILSTGSGRLHKNLYIGNCIFKSWHDYGCYIPDVGDTGFCGTTIQQPRGTHNGNGQEAAPWYPDQGPIRVSSPSGLIVLSNVDMASLNSWAHTGDPDNNPDESSRLYQPCFRWNDGERGSNMELVIDRFRGEGSSFGFVNKSGNWTVTPVWAIADRVYYIATEHLTPLETSTGGVTVRNGVFVIPNSFPGARNGTDQMFSDSAGGNTATGWNTRRSEVYSCVFADLRTDAQTNRRNGTNDGNKEFAIGVFDSISPSFLGNNIGYAPNRGPTYNGDTSQAPLNTTGRYTPVCDGERWEQEPVDTTRAPGTSATASFAPLTGSSAIGGASGKVSLLDMDGNVRSEVLAGLARSTPSEGPYEPDLEG